MRVLRSIVLLALFGAAIVPLQSQTALPTKLVQAGDITYVGSFNVPSACGGTGDQNSLNYGGHALGMSPRGLYVAGHDWYQKLAEISIPSIGGTASILTNCKDVPGAVGSGTTKLGGSLVYNGKLVVTKFVFYDGDGTASASHATGNTDITGFSAFQRVGTLNPAFYAGYMGVIPTEWRAALGGPAITGQGALSIISRTSSGPALFAFDPATLSSAPSALAYYPLSAPLANPDTQNTLYTRADMYGGVAFPSGTASVLVIGSHGTGKPCYGEASACGDPTNNSKGEHAYPYAHYVWAFNAADLAAVKAGTKVASSVRPYATWALTGAGGSGLVPRGGATFDPATNRIYLVSGNSFGEAPRIHVFQVGGASAPTTDTTSPTVGVTAPTAGTAVTGTATVTATATDNTAVASVWVTVDGSPTGQEDTTAPYQVSWDTRGVGNGTHALRAVARDMAGNVSTSSAVSVTVSNATADATAPTVSLSAPAAGATVSGTVAVSASASDNVAVSSVQFTLNGVNLGSADTTSPYSVNWSTTGAANGTHTLRAVARDAAGNVTTSASRSVTVSNQSSDTTAPSVSLTAPAAGATVSGTATVSASASDNVGVTSVQFTLNGVNLGSADTTAPYAISWSTTGAANGTHALRAVARDAAGNVTTSGSVSVTVSNSAGTTPPPTNTVTVSTVAQLQSAITSLVSNRTILIAAGTYSIPGDGLFIPQNLTNVTIAGATGRREDVVLQGAGMAGATRFGFWADKVDGLTFRDMTIRNVREHAVIANCGVNAPVYRNLRIVDIGDQFLKHNPGAAGCGVDKGIVEDSLLEYSTQAPDAYTNGVDVHFGADWIIRRNTFRNFVSASGLAGPAVLIWNGSSNTLVENNTFIDNARDVALGLDPTKPSQAPVSNSTITDHRGGRIAGNNITRRAGLAGTDVAIGLADSPGTVIESNQVRLNGSYPNAIEYRFPRTTGVIIRNNGVDGGIVARDGATATVSGTTAPGTPTPTPDPTPDPTPTPTDTTRPTIAITSPGSGQTVSGTVTIGATASDNVGVSSVRFTIDGVNLGSPDTTSPYSISWNTASVSNGNHTIRATAVDAAGNSSTTSITVNVRNRYRR